MGLEECSTRYLSTGANRQTSIADWSNDGLVAFGADVNVALWEPAVSKMSYNLPDEELSLKLRLVGSATRSDEASEWPPRHRQSSVLPTKQQG